METDRIFLNWNRPVVQCMAEYLLPNPDSGPVDMGRTLILVPTRQAGRRLLRALAERAPILSPRIETPNHLLRTPPALTNIAPPIEALGTWCSVLMKQDLAAYPALFPEPPHRADLAWAMPTARLIQQLRSSLAESGHRIGDVDASRLPEQERWDDLRRLEEHYIQAMAKRELYDAAAQQIKQSFNPLLPEDCDRIVLACIPDLNPIAQRALEQLMDRIPVSVLIHAPEELADTFGPWGRPLSIPWKTYPIDFPSRGKSLYLESGPEEQAARTLQIMAEEADVHGPRDVAIGVPDTDVIPHLAQRLEENRLPAFDPAGVPLTRHRVGHLLTALIHLRCTPSTEAIDRLLRHPDVTGWIEKSRSLPCSTLLSQLDRVRNDHLPPDPGTLLKRLGLLDLKSWMELSVKDLTAWLESLFDGRSLDPEIPEELIFIDVARQATRTIQLVAQADWPGLGEEDRFRLLMEQLDADVFYPGKGQRTVELEGWLELHWNPAPVLILTGMNEGIIPAGDPADPFLPESALRELGLRGEEERYARDTYLLAALQACRRTAGRLSCIVGRTNPQRDVLRPSRLLFHCRDEVLLQRTAHLFSEPASLEETAAWTRTLSLTPPPAELPDHLSVTKFRDYLACPFRFYLTHILGMRPSEYPKMEMDALDFGSGMHTVLETLGQGAWVEETDEGKLSAFLQEEAARWAAGKFGNDLSLPLQIQLRGMQQRLSAAARCHAAAVREGWRVVETEFSLRGEINGFRVTGKIDRVEQHRETGAWRILDYKTTDKADSPEAVHYKKRSKEWTDLQLPLYALLYPEPAAVGYFSLPKTVPDTGILLWEELQGDLLDDARKQAEAVVDGVRNGIFWPPAPKVKYDAFAPLFHEDPAKVINPTHLQSLMPKGGDTP